MVRATVDVTLGAGFYFVMTVSALEPGNSGAPWALGFTFVVLLSPVLAMLHHLAWAAMFAALRLAPGRRGRQLWIPTAASVALDAVVVVILVLTDGIDIHSMTFAG